MHLLTEEGIKNMSHFLLCIPGPWKNWGDFATRIYAAGMEPGPIFHLMPGDGFISHYGKNWHISTQFFECYPHLAQSFEITQQVRLIPGSLDKLPGYNSVVFLFYAHSFGKDRKTIIDSTRLIKAVGGLVVSVESTGAALTWEEWAETAESEDPLAWYREIVVLKGDETSYYSCGMQHFSLPDAEVDRSILPQLGSDLMTDFNCSRITGARNTEAGDIFSHQRNGTEYLLKRGPDHRHNEKNPFHNPYGVLRLHRN